VPATRYEILLPLKYNDGTDIEPEKLLLTKRELVARFGALTVDPAPVEGVWTYEGAAYQDYVLDIKEDAPEVQEFFEEFKETLKIRFRQIDVWIIAYPIRVV